MRTQFLATVLLALASSAAALTLVPAQNATFPQCGTQCAILLSSQQTCGSLTPSLQAENCFCNQPEIQIIYASPDTTCTQECSSPDDRNLVRDWFRQFCAQVQVGQDPLLGQEQDQQTGTTDPTSTPSPSPPAPRPGNPTTTTETGSTWFKHHWQWILMVVILAIAFLAIGFTARWYKKRHDLKVVEKPGYSTKSEQTRLSRILKAPSEKADTPRNAATPDLWGPHQHMAATREHQYDMERGASPVSFARDSPYQSSPTRSVKPGRAGRVEVYGVNDEISSAQSKRQNGGYGRF